MNETLTLEPSASNPRARVRVLRGQDDGHDFAVRVPLRCRTVEDALDWLRPDDVPRGSLRQGEFYFIPSGGPHAAAGCDHSPKRGQCPNPQCEWGKVYSEDPGDRGTACPTCGGSGQGPLGPAGVHESDCGSSETTEAGSEYRWTVDWQATFSRRHTATRCRAVIKSGEVAFIGRRKVKTHAFRARPRYFVAGEVEHYEHGTLVLPAHSRAYHGISWYEVVPNRAHGPFPVRGLGQED